MQFVLYHVHGIDSKISELDEKDKRNQNMQNQRQKQHGLYNFTPFNPLKLEHVIVEKLSFCGPSCPLMTTPVKSCEHTCLVVGFHMLLLLKMYYNLSMWIMMCFLVSQQPVAFRIHEAKVWIFLKPSDSTFSSLNFKKYWGVHGSY